MAGLLIKQPKPLSLMLRKVENQANEDWEKS
jgi:hypothetical protein